jgi:hypothetical protein
MNKLDHEEDLRSIIELKLKNGSTSNLSLPLKEKRNQSYITDFTDESHQNGPLLSKLKQYEG